MINPPRPCGALTATYHGDMLDHVALLVPSIEAAAAALGSLRAERGPVEEFPSEGTREMYIGAPGTGGRLLLLQPMGASGPYARAMAKRGPGLHHIAYRVADIDTFIDAHPGWLLHPISLKTHPRSATAWFARPGIPILLEVVTNPDPLTGPDLTSAIQIPVAPECTAMTERLEIRGGPARMSLEGRDVSIKSLVTGS
ncbi:MAG: VOC family protein [Phycisphaerales bacterium]